MEQLTKLLMKERKYVQETMQIENEREEIIERAFKDLKINDEEKTVTVLLRHVEADQQKQVLEEVTAELLETIVELRQNEKLNHDLINQSMQFVQLSLDMLQPSERNINYHKNNKEQNQVNRSVFDSKA